ncbi:restriction endonuclease subunit S [Vibrio fluvialis]|uniref:restriction endonuclease subunit S n=1 Tax=Vibrio fluvialis TaxID=676 RepID=UPI001EEBDA47|nr:restriction endonuclease subunit S [Vibrio fluvialis]MCG6399840.1 restriction endonuclease subunit S [Vibrio fluvialis]
MTTIGMDLVIPSGYKQSDVAVIPVDWNTVKLGALTKLIIDGTHHTPKYKPFGVPFLRVTDIQGELDDRKFKFVSKEEHDLLIKRCNPERGDLLLSKNGTIGVPKVINWDWDFSIFVSLALIKPRHDLLFVQYLEQFFKSNFLDRQLAQRAKQGTVTNLHLEEIRELLIPLPPTLAEQTAIANALSDVDTLISELEKLIAKKQAIKTATMQQLLTGTKRLPEFDKNEDGTLKGYKDSELGDIPEDWDVIEFGELFEESIAKNIPKGTEVVTFLGMQDVSENAQLLNQSLISYSKVKSGFTYFEKGDVLVAKITPCFENGKGCHTENLETQVGFGSTEFHVLRAKDNSDSKFVYFWTTRTSFRVDLEAEMVGSAGHRRVPLSALSSYKIPSPLVKEEQTAIAKILTDMEADVQALEQRLTKTRQIKQGMMQELLTGKTRLVKPESK